MLPRLSGPNTRTPRLLAGLLALAVTASAPSLLLAPAANADPAPLTVTVVDANSDAIAGVSVSATGAGGEITSDDTDPDGEASLALTADTYTLGFSLSGFHLDPEDAPGSVVVTLAGDVTVGGEPVEGDDLGQVVLQSDPKSVSGTVLGADNAGLSGITIQAVPQDGPPIKTTSVAGGSFALPLPIETYTITYIGAAVGNYTYINTPGGSVEVSQTATPTLTPQRLNVDDGSTKFDLKGTVSDWNGDALAGVAVTVFAAGGSTVAGSDTSTKVGEDAAFRVGVRPGKYQLRFEKAGYHTTYLENGADDGPVTVTVSATGTVSAPEIDLNADGSLPDVTLLLPPATMGQAPKLAGKAAVGETLTLSPGTWQGIDVDTEYLSVDWFIGGEPADDYSAGGWFQKFEVPIGAVGKKVGFRLTVDDPEGAHAPAVYEGSSGVVPKAAARLKGAFKKGKLSVALTVAGLPKPTGKILVKDGKKTIATIKLKAKSKGKAVAKLTKLKPGKHKLTLVYAGSKSIASAKATVKAKV